MRTLTSIALAASLALVLGAGQASALSSINLVYLGGATGTGSCTNGTDGVDCIHANESDTLVFAITMTVDTVGLAAYAFDVIFDMDGENELDLVTARHRASLNFAIPSTPPGNVNFIGTPITGTQESGVGGGFVYGFDSTVSVLTPPHPASLSFRVGVVAFHVQSGLNKEAGPDIQIGFFRPAGGAFGGAGPAFPFITPNFGSFTVDSVPEPGTSLLMGMGILGLIMAGRASRKS